MKHKKIRKTKYYKSIFWILLIAFIVVLSQFFIPAVTEILQGSLLFLLPHAIFSVLGAALIFFTIKEKVEGKLKIFLILTGISSAGFLIGIVLHNFIYALAIITKDIAILSYSMEILHAAFFLIAVIVCPIGFLIGAIGSIVLFFKKK